MPFVRQGLTDPNTGRLSNGGRIMSRQAKYRQVRAGLGLSTG